MKRTLKLSELKSLAISAQAVANTRKVPAKTITALYAISHVAKREIEAYKDELDVLKADEEANMQQVRNEIGSEVSVEEFNERFVQKLVTHQGQQLIAKRSKEIWNTKVGVNFTPITLEISDDFFDELPEKSSVKFLDFNASIDPLAAYQDLVGEELIIEETAEVKKVQKLKVKQK